MFCLTSNYSVF